MVFFALHQAMYLQTVSNQHSKLNRNPILLQENQQWLVLLVCIMSLCHDLQKAKKSFISNQEGFAENICISKHISEKKRLNYMGAVCQ